MDLAFDCIEIHAPIDAVDYRFPGTLGATAAGAAAYTEALAWVDTSCLAPCDESGRDCTSGACTTAAGAWVEYLEEGEGYSYGSYDSSSETITIEVTPPSEAWSTLRVERQRRSTRSGVAADSTTTYEVSWTGTLRADWPVDGAFSASSSDGNDIDVFDYAEESWDDGSCAWSSYRWEGWATSESVEMNGVDLGVWAEPVCGEWAGTATIDGVTWGIVDADTWEAGEDADGDGWPTEYDCDDTDASISPCGTEIAHDGVDQDCSGRDSLDGDGDGEAADWAGGVDCDDEDATVNTDAVEIAYDGVDQDCDGADLLDVDGDGHDADLAGGDDCDDEDDHVHPGVFDITYDGIDQDCDGADLTDFDGDGHDAELVGGDDCDDEDATINPGAVDVCGDGQDDDCDGLDCPPEDTGASEEEEEPAPPPVEIVDEGCRGGGSAWLVLFAPLLRRRRPIAPS